MKQEEIKFKIKTTSIDKMDVITQNTITAHRHTTSMKYRILSNNRKDWRNETVFAPGYFNKKTNFIIGESNSLYIVDKELKNIGNYNLSEINLDDKYMIYNIPCFEHFNLTTTIYSKKDKTNSVVELTEEFGYRIGKLLAKDEYDFNDNEILFVNNFAIKYNNDYIKLEKNIIINTNASFVLGILNGYVTNIGYNSFIIKKNINMYSFSAMFNYLGASYSIRNSKNNLKNMWIQIPEIFKKHKLNSKFFRKRSYIFNEEIGIGNISFSDNDKNLIGSINSGKTLLIALNDFNFEELTINDDNINDDIYDMTCENSSATNYKLGFTPYLKNSDGDILGVQGIFTREALEDVKKFNPENKEYYRDLNTGEISNWIADDAILGLYEITKDLDK